MEAPSFTGTLPTIGSPRDVRLTMRDVILMRVDEGLTALASGQAEFSHNLAIYGWDLRDAFLQGEPMLDAERHPLIHFHSARLAFRDGQLARIEGALTLRGVTQDVTLTVTRLACGNNSGDASGLDCQAHATTTIRRSAFGMDSFAPFLGDEVDLQFAIVAHRTADAITGR